MTLQSYMVAKYFGGKKKIKCTIYVKSTHRMIDEGLTFYLVSQLPNIYFIDYLGYFSNYWESILSSFLSIYRRILDVGE